MSIFKLRDNESSKPQAPQPSARPAAQSAPTHSPSSREQTHVAVGSKVVGEISGNAELLIDGHVEGKINLDSRLIIGPKGQIEGEVKARSVQISGRVQGNVEGVERVEVLRSGRLEGDMVAPQNGVHIAEGAYFTGKIDMTRKNAKDQKKATAPSGGQSPHKNQAPGGGGGGKHQHQGSQQGKNPNKR